MNCKNCNSSLVNSDAYCSICGAKVVNRISLKSLIAELVENVFGWDNKYFVTVKGLITKPGEVLFSYLDGTRKRYMNPLGFLLINLTVVIFIFNILSDQFRRISNKSSEDQISFYAENFGSIYKEESTQNMIREYTTRTQNFYLNYLNIVVALILPFYAFLSWLIFKKPYNYGEHLVINSYLLGLSFIFTSLFFIIAITINPGLFLFGNLLTVFFYCFAYKKLYKLTLAEIILKLLIFIGILIGAVIILSIIIIIITVVFLIIRDKFL